jgi:hypothetical protein
MSTPFETVHSVDDYYDGPRVGVADFHGKPHHFRSVAWIHKDTEWDSEDERFELIPVADTGSKPVVVRGTFRVRQPVPDLPKGVLRPLEVQWTSVEES